MAEQGNSVPRLPAQRAVRGWLGALALVAFGGVLAATALEIVVRMRATPDELFARSHPRIGYVMTPNFERTLRSMEVPGGTIDIRTNNLGLRRDADTSPEKPAGLRRVIVVGDSQTEGIVPNADTYCARLETLLNERRAVPAGLEVLNAAVSGYGPLLQLLWLREHGSTLEPDLVVVALYAGNDLAELLAREVNFGGYGPRFFVPRLERAGASWQIRYPGDDGVLQGVDMFLFRHSRLYVAARRTVERWAGERRSVLFELARTCVGCLQSIPQAYGAGGDPAKLAPAFERLSWVLEEFARAAERLGAGLVVAVIPTKLEVEPARVEKEVAAAAKLLGLSYDAVAFDRAVRERMVTTARERSIAVVDLMTPLHQAAVAGEGPLYWALDWHLNPAGQAVIARHLAPIVAERLDAGSGGRPG